MNVHVSFLVEASEINPSLQTAKVSCAIVPQEYELENFVKDVTKAYFPSWNTNTPACEWIGVFCNELGKISRNSLGAIRNVWFSKLFAPSSNT